MGNEAQLAYAAGILDGEGCIAIHAYKPSASNKRKTVSHTLWVVISNTEWDLIDWMLKNFGGTWTAEPPMNKPKKRGKKRIFRWKVAGDSASGFLKSVMPYLTIKTAQAEVALEFQATKAGQHFVTNSAQEIRKRELFKTSLRTLKNG